MTKIQAASETPLAAEKDPLDGLVPGRIVWYFPTVAQSRHALPGPWPAMVLAVGEGGLVTLNVNLPAPTLIGDDPVQRMIDVKYAGEKGPDADGVVDEEGKVGKWTWIFKGQAGRYKPDRTA